jgi:hypothetical protein
MFTEARAVLKLPTPYARHAWLSDLERLRGVNSVRPLRATMSLINPNWAVEGALDGCPPEQDYG